MHTHATVDRLRLDAQPSRIAMLAALLSADEHARAQRFRFPDDRRRFVVARGRLRQLLGAQLGVPPREVALRYGANGKPLLAARFAGTDLRFNLSHSGEIAIIVLTTGRDIGVDVEQLRQLDDADQIVAAHFSTRERQEYESVQPELRIEAFFNGWTRKEALVKAIGSGLSLPLDCFDVSLAPGEPALLHRLHGRTGADCGWHLHSFAPAAGYVAAIAVGNGPSDHAMQTYETQAACDQREMAHG